MKSINIIHIFLIALTITAITITGAGCCFAEEANEKPNYKSTIDYIQKTGRLEGISEVSTNQSNSIILVDAKSGHGCALWILAGGNSSTLNIGESCRLIDGDHVSITYKFKAIENGKIIIVVTDKFDARSFGDGIKEETATVTISPYKTKEPCRITIINPSKSPHTVSVVSSSGKTILKESVPRLNRRPPVWKMLREHVSGKEITVTIDGKETKVSVSANTTELVISVEPSEQAVTQHAKRLQWR